MVFLLNMKSDTDVIWNNLVKKYDAYFIFRCGKGKKVFLKLFFTSILHQGAPIASLFSLFFCILFQWSYDFFIFCGRMWIWWIRTAWLLSCGQLTGHTGVYVCTVACFCYSSVHYHSGKTIRNIKNHKIWYIKAQISYTCSFLKALHRWPSLSDRISSIFDPILFPSFQRRSHPAAADL